MNVSSSIATAVPSQTPLIVWTLYAVTVSGSVYHLTYDDEAIAVDAVKIFAKEGSRSLLPVGQRLGNLHRLQQMIALGNLLIPYIPERNGLSSQQTGFERRLEHVSYAWWGTNSSFVVGYFDNEEDAKSCVVSEQLAMCDPRWLEGSKVLLNRVGDQHPRFYVPVGDSRFAFR